MREMVRDNARRCQAVVEQLGGQVPPLLTNYRVRFSMGMPWRVRIIG